MTPNIIFGHGWCVRRRGDTREGWLAEHKYKRRLHKRCKCWSKWFCRFRNEMISVIQPSGLGFFCKSADEVQRAEKQSVYFSIDNFFPNRLRTFRSRIELSNRWVSVVSLFHATRAHIKLLFSRETIFKWLRLVLNLNNSFCMQYRIVNASTSLRCHKMWISFE